MSPRHRPARSHTRLLLSALVLLGGCRGRAVSIEQARAATVIEAAGAKLTGASFERWLQATEVPASDSTASLLVSTWIDAALLATAMQRGPSLDDSATVDAAILPDAIRGTMLEFWQERAASRPTTDAQVDSLIALDSVRLLQQLLLWIPRGSDSATLGRIAARAAELFRRASLPGASFSALVREASEDSAGRANGGFLPAVTRDQLPALIAPTVWALQPGEVSPVLRSEVGFHIFRRATRNESRAGLRSWLEPQLALIAGRSFTDSVVQAYQVRLAPDALARVRAMAHEPITASEGTPPASWSGGALAPARVRDWVLMLSPVERLTLADVSDSAATILLNDLAVREIVFGLAVPQGGVPARARGLLAPAYHAALDSVKAIVVRVGKGRNGDPASTASAVVDSVAALRLQFSPLPGALAGILRSRYPVSVDTTALRVLLRASRTAWDKR